MFKPGFGASVRYRLNRFGFYYGWIVVIGCFVSATITFATIYSFSVFFRHIVTTFEQSHANTSIVFSIQSIVTFGGAAILGFFVDRYGVRQLMVLGALFLAGGLLGASQSPVFVGVIVAYGVVAAAGLSVIYVIAYATVPRWFDRRRGLATGIATSGGGAGILLGPQLAESLIGALGWQNAYVTMTGVFVVFLGIVALVIDDSPASMGIMVGGNRGPREPHDAVGEWREQVSEVLNVARTGPFVLVFLGYLCFSVPMFFAAAHLVEFTTSAGIGRRIGILALSVIGGLNVVAKWVVGPIADRIGIAHSLAAASIFMGLSMTLMAVSRTATLVLGAAVLFGIGYGGSIALMSPMIAELFGTLNINALFGLIGIAFAFTGAVVPYLAGVGFDVLGTYVHVLVLSGLVSLVAAFAIEAADRMHTPTGI